MSTKTNFLSLETVAWGGGLPCKGPESKVRDPKENKLPLSRICREFSGALENVKTVTVFTPRPLSIPKSKNLVGLF